MKTSEAIQEVRMLLMQAKRNADRDTADALKIAESALALAEGFAYRKEETSA